MGYGGCDALQDIKPQNSSHVLSVMRQTRENAEIYRCNKINFAIFTFF
jgi:hypothetical protein